MKILIIIKLKVKISQLKIIMKIQEEVIEILKEIMQVEMN